MLFDTYYWVLLMSLECQAEEADMTQPTASYERQGKKKFNTCQFIPRPSTELRDDGERYNLLQDCFEEVFDWITNLVITSFFFFMKLR